jgi:hypothetical protein
MLMAPLVSIGGAVATNIFTLLAFTAALALWHSWCRKHTSHPVLLTVSFAFAPLAWIASASNLDYVWSLLFLMAALQSASYSRSTLAGIMLGLAIGFRPSNAMFAVVLFFLIDDSTDVRGRGVGRLFIAASLTALVAFLPVLVTYGASGWIRFVLDQVNGVDEPLAQKIMLATYRGVYAFGPLAIAAIIVAFVVNRSHLMTQLKSDDKVLRGAVAGLGAMAVLFALLPAERSYLLPALPLMLVALDRVASRKLIVIVAILMVSYAFVNPDVIRHAGRRGVPGFNIRAGIVVEELDKREALERKREFLSTLILPESTIVMTGSATQMWLGNHAFVTDTSTLNEIGVGIDVRDVADVPARRRDDRSVFIVSVLSKDQIARGRERGFRFAVTGDAREYAEWVGGFNSRRDSVEVLGIPAAR